MPADPTAAEMREAWEALRAWGEARVVGQRLVELDALHAARALADRIAAQAAQYAETAAAEQEWHREVQEINEAHPPRVTPDDWATVQGIADEADRIGATLVEICERHGLEKLICPACCGHGWHRRPNGSTPCETCSGTGRAGEM